MSSMAWWLGLGRAPDPASARDQLRRKIGSARLFTGIMVGNAVGMGWHSSAQATHRPIQWEQLSFALCWGLLVLLAMMMPAIVGHHGWPAERRRLVVRLVWLAAVLLVLAGAWDFALFNDRRWGVFFAWIGLFMGAGIGLVLLGLMGWFTLAGMYLAQLAACTCPPPVKRWMRTAPLPRREYGPHVCPSPEGRPEITPADSRTEAASSAA